jgi:hypothetical protein
MVEQIVTNVLGTLVLLVTALGAYYANGLKSNLAGSELAKVWKFIGMGVILLFLGALAGGGSSLIGLDSLTAILIFILLGSICLTYGLKLQLDKVR